MKKGWNPAIEHTEPEHLMDNYWYMWKLPMFGETDVERILGRGRSLPQSQSRTTTFVWSAMTTSPSPKAPPW